MSIEEAKDKGAMALFSEKYGDTVRVVEVTPDSMELCGGTHVSHVREIYPFCILSESAIASGVRRITAVAGVRAVEHMQSQVRELHSVSTSLQSTPETCMEALERLKLRTQTQNEKIKVMEKEIVLKYMSDNYQIPLLCANARDRVCVYVVQTKVCMLHPRDHWQNFQRAESRCR